MASYILFIAYSILFSWWIYKSRWVRSTGLTIKLLVVFFILKIIVGCVYGYWYSYQQHADTWSFHQYGLEEYKLLFNEPLKYLTNLFDDDYPGGWEEILTNKNSDWNDLKDHLMGKTLSILNIFSFGNYYVNVVLYSFITFFGYLFLYRGLNAFYGNLTKGATVFLFLTPSCLFWTSGIHKDGLVLLFISFIIYCLSKIFIERKSRGKMGVLLVCNLILLFLFRNYVALGILPTLVAIMISYFIKTSPLKVFMAVYLLSLSVFFASGMIDSRLSLPQRIVDLRTDFQQMTGNSRLNQAPLQPTVTSFLLRFPEAIDHALLRPYVWQADGIPQIVAGVEVIMFLLIVLFTVFFHKTLPYKPIDWFIIFFSLGLLLFIGYIISFSGAIVRYRAIYMMLIVVLCLQHFDFAKLSALFRERPVSGPIYYN